MKITIKLFLVVLMVPVAVTCAFVGHANADALSVSCQISPANSLQSPAPLNTSMNFSPLVSGGTGNYTYTWFGACVGSGSTCQQSFSSPGVYTAYLTVDDGNDNQTGSCSAFVAQSCISHDHKACVGNNVYWFNSCNVQEDQYQACGAGTTCCNAVCTPIVCSQNSDCGTDGLTGNPFCKNGNVYQSYKTWTCNNPGTVNATCTSALADQLQTTCTAGQTCNGGSCTTPTANLAVSCFATPNPATTNSSVTFAATPTGGTAPYTYNWLGACSGSAQTCSNTFSAAGTQTASVTVTSSDSKTATATCSVGVSTNCTPNSTQRCVGNSLYNFDSCGVQGTLIQTCPNGCSGSSCNNNNNSLSVQTYAATNTNGNQATLNGYVYTNQTNNNNCTTNVWFQYGTSTYYGNTTNQQTQNFSGQFSQTAYNLYSGTTYHFRAVAQDCTGNIVYGQDMTIYNNNYNNGGNLTVTKQVRDLTNGSGFSNSTNANPGDVLMYLVTLQNNSGQTVNNVFIRDNLPANLIYNNQMVVAGLNNNYSGDIMSGLNLNTVNPGQTVTISYQVQVAGVANFSYGTTTLNNTVTTTTSSGGYIPTASATAIVTRTAVYGASSVSTGLTNNFWVDSFFLPLLITLLALWMWRSGMFFGLEKWLADKRKNRQGFQAQRKLEARIEKIRKVENF